jgi:hypothetical protein
MAIEPCAYCGEVALCDLWHQACVVCEKTVIMPAFANKERFIAKAGGLRSYPESWLRENGHLIGEPDKRLVVGPAISPSSRTMP